MQQAFDALTYYWSDQQEVPKAFASLFIDIRGLFRVSTDYSTAEEAD